MPSWKERFRQEIERAGECRANGNEGQARVCARRAAGIAIREYSRQRGLETPSPSAIDLLNGLADLPGVPVSARQSARYLTLRVDEQFALPAEVDLIHEARSLCEQLLPGGEEREI
jgi:hypothetical protein